MVEMSRGNLVWGMFMVLAVVLFLAANAPGAAFVVGAMSLLLIMLMTGQQLQKSLPAVRPIPQRVGVSNAARVARTQASHRPDFDTYYTPQDVGVIIDEPRRDGLQLRRARFVSLDDEALRPYVVLNAPHRGHPAQVIIRFEITDAAGAVQFVYEMDYYMRAGENAVLPDYRLPLRGNTRLDRSGKWDLMVWVNGGLVGIHTFSVSPSLEERQRQLRIDGEVAHQQFDFSDDPAPLSLEELLSRQPRTNRS